MGALNMLATGAKTAATLDAQGKEAAFNLNQDQENIQLSKYAEQDAAARGSAAVGKARMAGSQAAAEQGFLYANSGVDATVGTAADVQAATAAQGELNALTVQNNAAREVWGHQKTTASLRRQKDINLQRANSQQTATILGGLADGAGGALKGG